MVDERVYIRNANGQILAETRNGVTTNTYSYDERGQVIGDGNGSYSFDLSGNRNSSGHVTGDDNQLESDGTWNYTYNAVSDLVGKTNIVSGEIWTYAYNLDMLC